MHVIDVGVVSERENVDGVSEAEEATTVVLCRGESECTLPA